MEAILYNTETDAKILATFMSPRAHVAKQTYLLCCKGLRNSAYILNQYNMYKTA